MKIGDVPTELLACPRCRSSLAIGVGDDSGLVCEKPDCDFHRQPFPSIGDIPVLVDFESSLLDRTATLASSGRSPLEARVMRPSFKQRAISKMLNNRGDTLGNAEPFVNGLLKLSEHPRVLIVGGGTVGDGSQPLYADDRIAVISADIYASPDVDIVADGHRIPLQDSSVEGVWIQAVLEHVLEPHQVVAEIHRVLVPGGIVYAETPFMQQVHEGPYDFTRFTPSGHRWLFKDFTEILSGNTAGPAAVVLWAIRYYVAALSGSQKMGFASSLPFFWLNYLERFAKSRHSSDGPSGVYFMGSKASKPIKPKEIVAYYKGAQR